MHLDDAERRHAWFAIEELANLVEGKAELAERFDLLKPRDIVTIVEAMSRFAASRRLQQANRVVVMERAHRHAGAFRQFSDFEEVVRHQEQTYNLTLR